MDSKQKTVGFAAERVCILLDCSAGPADFRIALSVFSQPAVDIAETRPVILFLY
jgi:hypothetical protein